MKKTFLLFLTTIFSLSSFAQEIVGQWNGALEIQGIQLRLIFKVTKSENGYSATMDSPDQGAKDIPVTQTVYENPKIKFVIANAGIEYSGILNHGQFVGTLKQAGMEFPLNLSRESIVKQTILRPQEPNKPFPYISKDVSFKNGNAGITLSGTLSLPKETGSFPAVVLISGSGPQNRNHELFGHKPFLIISDYLTKNGIAVLRFDDRGVGQSQGDFKSATTHDLANDVESAVSYLKTLKEIDQDKIGLIGHSEGGIIAPMVATKTTDVKFIVLLAGTGIPGDELLLLQQETIARSNGVSEDKIQRSLKMNSQIFKIIKESSDEQTLKRDLSSFMKEALTEENTDQIPNGMSKEQFISTQVEQISSPWTKYFLKLDPTFALEKVKCPVLALNGEKDLQVSSGVNLKAISASVKKGGNMRVTTRSYPDLNHLFQRSETGLPTEYASISQTFSPKVLTDITNWILNQTN